MPENLRLSRLEWLAGNALSGLVSLPAERVLALLPEDEAVRWAGRPTDAKLIARVAALLAAETLHSCEEVRWAESDLLGPRVQNRARWANTPVPAVPSDET